MTTTTWLHAGVVVGRIMFTPAAPADRPWLWASGHSADSVGRTAHGDARGGDGGIQEELAAAINESPGRRSGRPRLSHRRMLSEIADKVAV